MTSAQETTAMILFPAFGSPRRSPQAAPADEARVEDRPVLAWRICPQTNRPVMVWTLPEPQAVAACA